MKRLLLGLLLMVPLTLWAEWNPAKTNRMVNDYAGLLSASQVAEMEQRLEAFSDTTSNQIVIVTTNTLDGDDEDAVAQRIGQSWGVGGKAHNNGMIILILDGPEGHAIAISTGYGLEGAFPDLFCKRILEDVMIPIFRDENDYYKGLCAGLEVILPVAAGEYSFEQYEEDNKIPVGIKIFLIVCFIAFIAAMVWVSKKNGGGGISSGGSGPIYMSGPTSRGYSSGMGNVWGGGSSGGFGGFGGFGGGSFGGGGASGRW